MLGRKSVIKLKQCDSVEGREMTEDFLGLFRNDPGVVLLKPAQELFKKGEPGSYMYVVKSGEVQVVDGNHVFETVSPG